MLHVSVHAAHGILNAAHHRCVDAWTRNISGTCDQTRMHPQHSCLTQINHSAALAATIVVGNVVPKLREGWRKASMLRTSHLALKLRCRRCHLSHLHALTNVCRSTLNPETLTPNP